MVDVVVCYARENAATAGQLADAVRRRGYSLWSEDALSAEGADSDITERIGSAKAAIVIWSEAAAASEWVRAEANFARGQKKLIQASADDRPPPLPFRPGDVASLSSWQGEEGHPGWQRIKAGLEALGGPGSAGTGAVPGAVRRAASPPAPPAAARRQGSGFLLAGITLALLAAVALVTFFWMRGLAPTARDEGAAPRASTGRPVAATSAPPPEAAAPDQPMPESAPAPEPPDSEVGEQPERRPTGPRINRRNAENMRLFCERAGRGTPECRTFVRRLRNQRR